MAGSSDLGPLVTCEWLQGKMTSDDMKGVVILDVSWSSQKDCRKEFASRHIPGAVYLDVMVGPHTELFPRNLPTLETFEEAAQEAGVCEDSHVILYSESDICGFFLSGRAWWTCKVLGLRKVSVLDGGLQRWLSLGYTTTADTTQVQKGNFKADPQPSYRWTFDNMKEAVSSGQPTITILDTRPTQAFANGHIPGARNLHAAKLVDADSMKLKSVAQLKQLLEEVGVETGKKEKGRVVCYCNSGMSSCTLALALTLCDFQHVSLYHGGFTEWKTRAPESIEKC